MQLEEIFSSSFPVELIDVLSDHDHAFALLFEPLLGVSNGYVRRVGMLRQHELSPVVVELPDQ